jgi:hypothetical protein
MSSGAESRDFVKMFVENQDNRVDPDRAAGNQDICER